RRSSPSRSSANGLTVTHMRPARAHWHPSRMNTDLTQSRLGDWVIARAVPPWRGRSATRRGAGCLEPSAPAVAVAAACEEQHNEDDEEDREHVDVPSPVGFILRCCAGYPPGRDLTQDVRSG